MDTIQTLKVGDVLSIVECPPVTRLDLIKYAGASGDYNPIHTIDEEAKKAGLPGIIAHGMWTMGQLSRVFSPYLHEGFVKSYTVRFQSMVFLGEKLSLEAELIEQKDDEYTFLVQAVKRNQERAIQGKAIFKVY
ncbi:MAG: MaoC/PaaZ C-terminal domain-containing protein [Tuberibacillus sp.]